MAYFEGIEMTGGYGNGPDIINSCSVEVNKGEIVSILGPNGAGKSTAMKAMLGLLNLKSGSVKIDGKDISKLSPQDRVKQGISFVPQTKNVFAGMTVEENLEMGAFLVNSEIKNIIEEIKTNLDKSFGNNYDFRRVENVGPKVSAELLKSGVIAISLSLALMLIYIWIRFEWQFSLGAILALFHDVIVTLGVFSLFSLEINLSIIAAVLTIVGYSMNDTVVIFDRVRENLRKYSDIKIFELTNISINETLSRTIITSATTLLALLAIYFFGGEILKGFSLAMILGVVFGTYSSIYIANTVLVRLRVSQKTVLREDDQNKLN